MLNTIFIIADDLYFSLGAQEMLTSSGYNARVIDIHEMETVSTEFSQTRDNIILLATDCSRTIERVRIFALANGARIIYIINGTAAQQSSFLWAQGIIPKKIACHQLAPAIISIKRQEVTWMKGLTLREMEIMNQLVKGKNNHLISEEMHISEKTVSAHKNSALKKLGLTRLNSNSILIYGKYRQVLQQRLFS